VELSVKEDEILYSYETDEGWTLVKSKVGSVGYVPGNYIEQVSANTCTLHARKYLIVIETDESQTIPSSPLPVSSSSTAGEN
jgi:hypothetical protein